MTALEGTGTSKEQGPHGRTEVPPRREDNSQRGHAPCWCGRKLHPTSERAGEPRLHAEERAGDVGDAWRSLSLDDGADGRRDAVGGGSALISLAGSASHSRFKVTFILKTNHVSSK